jgi:hypothetical protein
VPGQENFRFNLWLFQSTAPAGSGPVEVVVNDFAYLPLVAGDFDNDGAVDAADLTRWFTSYGATRGADADADGDTDGADFLTWQRSMGAAAAGSAAAMIPEPSAMALAVAAVAAFSSRGVARLLPMATTWRR